MNKDRRRRIDSLITALEKLNLEDLAGDARALYEEEQETFDNMPEGLQASDRGQMSEQAVNCLDEAATNLEEALEALQAAIDQLSEAQA